MEKLYKVQMNSKGMPNFSTAVEVADRPQGEWIPCSKRLPSEFEKGIHKMFDHIWDCEIDHPVFQDTVGELMGAVIQLYDSMKGADDE